MSILREVPTSDINPNELNPRRTVGDVSELAQSIESQGLVQPIVIAPAPDGTEGEWVIIAGHRRFAAVTELGWMHVPALIREDLTEPADVISAMLIENGQRNDLKITEEGDALLALDDLGLSQTEISKRAGRSHKWTKTRIVVAGLPEPMRHAVDDGQLTISDAMAYADLPEPTRAQIDINDQPGRIATQVNRHVKVRQNIDKEQKIRAEATEAGYSEFDHDTDSHSNYRSIVVAEGEKPPAGAKFRIDSFEGQFPPMVRWLAPVSDDDHKKDAEREKEHAEQQARQDRAQELAEGRFRDLAVITAGHSPDDTALVERILRESILDLRGNYWAQHALEPYDPNFAEMDREDAAAAGWFCELDETALAALFWTMQHARAIFSAVNVTWDGRLAVDQKIVDKLSELFDLGLSAAEREFIAEHTPANGDDEAGAA